VAKQWDKAYTLQFLDEFPPSWWAEARPWVNDRFAKHVDALYAAAANLNPMVEG